MQANMSKSNTFPLFMVFNFRFKQLQQKNFIPSLFKIVYWPRCSLLIWYYLVLHTEVKIKQKEVKEGVAVVFVFVLRVFTSILFKT